MKLIVQIPCHNEQETLPAVLADIPRRIDGVDKVEVLVIDDGSTDRTVEVAREHGADHVISSRKNRGLARTFRFGLETAIQLGADVIVNTDGDNQYAGADIPKLIEPIVAGRADIVIGDRQTAGIRSFSWIKRLLQNWGSAVVAKMSDVDVPDAVSGFRAFSREAALDTNIVSSFSYTIETLIQAGRKHYAVVSVPIRVNPTTRPSRLFSSVPQFLARSVATMLRIYAMYQPLKVYFYFGSALVLLGSIPIIRFLIYYFSGHGEGKIQSLVIGAILITFGGLSLMFGLVADLINFNRQLSEMTLERLRRLESRLLVQKTKKAGSDVDKPAGQD
jgi:glycosyltransferase involved in cell wall biosynthesis